ncbi:MAG: hypothetical protein ITD33_06790 [Nitrosarchaeum sp.]|nr:hypothetical protein [Nitrosarchaeum sp.]
MNAGFDFNTFKDLMIKTLFDRTFDKVDLIKNKKMLQVTISFLKLSLLLVFSLLP